MGHVYGRAGRAGRGDRTRTCNRWFWRPVLYQLSYTPIGANPLRGYLVSLCSVCCRQRGQNLFSSRRPGSFLLFLRVLYVRSLQVVHASAITGRFSALATCDSLRPSASAPRCRPRLTRAGAPGEGPWILLVCGRPCQRRAAQCRGSLPLTSGVTDGLRSRRARTIRVNGSRMSLKTSMLTRKPRKMNRTPRNSPR
jgi:hypothetical protein